MEISSWVIVESCVWVGEGVSASRGCEFKWMFIEHSYAYGVESVLLLLEIIARFNNL